MPQRTQLSPPAQYWSEISFPPDPHLFYLPRFFYEQFFLLIFFLCPAIFSLFHQLFFLFYPQHLLSRRYSPFLRVIVIFLCCSSTTCLFASSTPPIPWHYIHICSRAHSALRNAPWRKPITHAKQCFACTCYHLRNYFW